MNWIQFLQTTGAVYLCYYALVITFELAGQQKSDKINPGNRELIFHQEDLPQQVSIEEPAMPQDGQAYGEQMLKESPGVLPSAGGESMSSLVALAKADVTRYTREMPY